MSEASLVHQWRPHMQPLEIDMYVSFTRCCTTYLEFGSGGSTVLACHTTEGTVTSVDSSSEWQAKVAEECRRSRAAVRPTLIHADVGPTKEWGWPVDHSRRSSWPTYYRTAWPREADLVLIDGRFRVASFLVAAMTCLPGTIILIHDFDRDYYQSVRCVAREIARTGTLAAFTTRAFNSEEVLCVLGQHEYDPR